MIPESRFTYLHDSITLMTFIQDMGTIHNILHVQDCKLFLNFMGKHFPQCCGNLCLKSSGFQNVSPPTQQNRLRANFSKRSGKNSHAYLRLRGDSHKIQEGFSILLMLGIFPMPLRNVTVIAACLRDLPPNHHLHK